MSYPLGYSYLNVPGVKINAEGKTLRSIWRIPVPTRTIYCPWEDNTPAFTTVDTKDYPLVMFMDSSDEQVESSGSERLNGPESPAAEAIQPTPTAKRPLWLNRHESQQAIDTWFKDSGHKDSNTTNTNSTGTRTLQGATDAKVSLPVTLSKTTAGTRNPPLPAVFDIDITPATESQTPDYDADSSDTSDSESEEIDIRGLDLFQCD